MKRFFFLPWFKWSEKINPDMIQASPDDLPEPLYPYEHNPETLDGNAFPDGNFRTNELAVVGAGIINEGMLNEGTDDGEREMDSREISDGSVTTGPA